MRRAGAFGLLLAVALGLPARAEAPEPAGSGAALARLEAAAERHPDDPDLAWALALRLLEADRPQEAAERLRAFEARWPGLRPSATLELGRALYAAGSDAEALIALERALARDPADAAAHLYRGLVLRRLGRAQEAETALAEAARLAPELAAETLLLRALSRLETGDEAAAEGFLRDSIELDPQGESAQRARLILGDDASLWPSWISLQLHGGMEHDSNVTLDSGTDLPGLVSSRRDDRRVWGTGLLLRPLQGERFGLTLGAFYDQSEHDELDSYDTRRELGFVSARWRTSPRTLLRLDSLVSRTRLDDRRYERDRLVRPNLLIALGERVGVLRLYSEWEQVSYHEEPLFDSLERDGTALGGGVEHTVPIPGWEQAWGALDLRFRRLETDARRDLLGFESPYDHDAWTASLRVHLPLWWGFSAESHLSLGHERYAHRNLYDFLTDDGVGNPDPRERRDTLLEGGLALVRPITRFARAELVWRGFSRVSNVDVYDYDRRVLGFYLRLQTP
jgi:tetratricopeptide (TPR) repeat protein